MPFIRVNIVFNDKLRKNIAFRKMNFDQNKVPIFVPNLMIPYLTRVLYTKKFSEIPGDRKLSNPGQLS